MFFIDSLPLIFVNSRTVKIPIGIAESIIKIRRFPKFERTLSEICPINAEHIESQIAPKAAMKPATVGASPTTVVAKNRKNVPNRKYKH